MRLAIVSALLFAPLIAAAPNLCDVPCTITDIRKGACTCNTGAIHEDAVALEAWASHSAGGGGQSSSTAENSTRPGADPRDNSGATGSNTDECIQVPDQAPICTFRDDFEVVVITLSDIASFRPAPGRQAMEPDGWAVTGLHTNIHSTAGSQIVDGTLLDQPASVRFIPVAWLWDYGDGHTATHTTPGGTWDALRLREFDPTPTSHVYTSKGSFTIGLDIRYRAEYSFGDDAFVPIAGTLTLPANDLHITATGIRTVLVHESCTANPTGPGC